MADSLLPLLHGEEDEVCIPLDWEKNGGFMLHLFVMGYVFYGFAIMCDEFFVPALNVFCEKLKMPADFAGATLMAGGACAPDLFSGLVGVLVLHTDVGVGTIVGSLLFNHLCIIGGSAIAVGLMLLEWKTVLRETVFYIISLVCLLLFLLDHKFDWWESMILVLIYVLYVIVCAFYAPVLKFLTKIENFCSNKDYRQLDDSEVEQLINDSQSKITGEMVDRNVNTAPPRGSIDESEDTSFVSKRKKAYELEKSIFDQKEVEIIDSTAFGHNEKVIMHGFLLKQSRFYTRINMSTRMWQKRWFMLGEQFYYCRNPLYPNKDKRIVPLTKASEITIDPVDHTLFHITTATYVYTLKASSDEVAVQWVDLLRDRLNKILDVLPQYNLDQYEDDETNLLEWPSEGPLWRKIAYVVTFPLHLLFTLTVPNVKKAKWESWFPLTFVMVLIWLGFMSYGMIYSADRFACVLGISQDITGLTITAIGASLPSLFSSIIAARAGSANMAIANAFGANTFTILLALGLPSLIQSTIVTPGLAVTMDSSSINFTVLVLSGALFIFILTQIIFRLRITRGLGVFYVLLYFALLSLVVTFHVLGIDVI